MIAEALIIGAVDGVVAFFALMASFGLDPVWPGWLVGSGAGTVDGAFDWIATGIEPFAAWVNLGLLSSVVGLLFALQAGFLSWGLIVRVVSLARAALP